MKRGMFKKVGKVLLLYLFFVACLFAVFSVIDLATYRFLLHTEVFDASELSFEKILQQEIWRVLQYSLITGIVTSLYFLTEHKE